MLLTLARLTITQQLGDLHLSPVQQVSDTSAAHLCHVHSQPAQLPFIAGQSVTDNSDQLFTLILTQKMGDSHPSHVQQIESPFTEHICIVMRTHITKSHCWRAEQRKGLHLLYLNYSMRGTENYADDDPKLINEKGKRTDIFGAGTNLFLKVLIQKARTESN
jgi:hypothetical protein